MITFSEILGSEKAWLVQVIEKDWLPRERDPLVQYTASETVEAGLMIGMEEMFPEREADSSQVRKHMEVITDADG